MTLGRHIGLIEAINEKNFDPVTTLSLQLGTVSNFVDDKIEVRQEPNMIEVYTVWKVEESASTGTHQVAIGFNDWATREVVALDIFDSTSTDFATCIGETILTDIECNDLELVGSINVDVQTKVTLRIPNCYLQNVKFVINLIESEGLLMITYVTVTNFGRNLVSNIEAEIEYVASQGDDRIPDSAVIHFGDIFNTNAFCAGKPFMCAEANNEIEFEMSAKFLDNRDLENGRKYNFTLDFQTDTIVKQLSGTIQFSYNPWGKTNIPLKLF